MSKPPPSSGKGCSGAVIHRRDLAAGAGDASVNIGNAGGQIVDRYDNGCRPGAGVLDGYRVDDRIAGFQEAVAVVVTPELGIFIDNDGRNLQHCGPHVEGGLTPGAPLGSCPQAAASSVVPSALQIRIPV